MTLATDGNRASSAPNQDEMQFKYEKEGKQEKLLK